jgi:FMN phosphatase YigB (HAD superfamily)
MKNGKDWPSVVKNLPISCLAFDFGGTLAYPGPSPNGDIVARVWTRLFGQAPPDGYDAAFNAVQNEVNNADRERSIQTPFETILYRAAERIGGYVPDLAALAQAVFDTLPDAVVDPHAATALHQLCATGLPCILACDTQRPERVRRHTLAVAGIADCFAALLLSSSLGVRKPHPLFYAAVLDAAGCEAERVLFVGDTPNKDVFGPIAYGMQAILIARDAFRPDDFPDTIPVLPHVEALPVLLARRIDQC